MNVSYHSKFRPSALRLVLLAFAACLPLVFAKSSNAQQAASQPVPKQAPRGNNEKVQHVFPLRYIAAQQTVAIISDLIADDASDSRIASDDAQNTIIVSANPNVINKVKDLIEILDVQGKSKEATTTVLDVLGATRDVAPSEAFLQQAAALWNVEVAVDRDTNVLMLKGDADKVERVQEVIRTIQSQSVLQKTKEDEKGTSLIRIVWLASQKSLADPPKRLPEDLFKVALKLQDLGIEDVGVACQLLARQESPEFSVSGMASFKEASVRLQVQASPAEGQPDVTTFRITGANHKNEALFEMSIGARLVPNKMTVLASAPITLPSVNSDAQETQSVLVVQMIEGL